MGGWTLGASAALALMSAVAANAAPHMITNPDWATKPDGAAIAKLYPVIAEAYVLDGRAVVTCEVAAEGLMTNCVASDETPPGIGFSAAVVAAAKSFRMQPKTIDGQPVAGGIVRIPLHFVAPISPQLSEGASYVPPTVTPKAMELGQRLVALRFERVPVETYIDAQFAKDFDAKPDGVDEATFQEVAATLKAALRDAVPTLKEAVAREYAAEYTVEEMTGFLATANMPGGRDRALASARLKDNRVISSVLAATLTKARSQFCLKRDCSIRFGIGGAIPVPPRP
jgi:TonB family protein